jgi:hypothetical protein
LGSLKTTVYARMEEMSFRSGAAVTGGVLAAAGVAVTLAVLLGGHGAPAASAPLPGAAARSVAPPSSTSPAASPPVTPRASRTTAPVPAAEPASRHPGSPPR